MESLTRLRPTPMTVWISWLALPMAKSPDIPTIRRMHMVMWLTWQIQQVQLPSQFSSKLDILSVTTQIFAALLLSSYHLANSDNDASDQLLILQITQSLWANNILLLKDLNLNGFQSYTISTDKIGIELEDPQISDFIRYCYTHFYDIDRGTYHKHQKVRQVQHAWWTRRITQHFAVFKIKPIDWFDLWYR